MPTRGSLIGKLTGVDNNSGVWNSRQAYRRVTEGRWPRASVTLDNFSLATIATNGTSAAGVTRSVVATLGTGNFGPGQLQFTTGSSGSLTLTYASATPGADLGSVGLGNFAVLSVLPDLYIRSNVAGGNFTVDVSAQLFDGVNLMASHSSSLTTTSGSFVTTTDSFQLTPAGAFDFTSAVVTFSLSGSSTFGGWLNFDDLGNGGSLQLLEATPPPPPPPQ